MKVKIINEAGYNEAIEGLKLSYNKESIPFSSIATLASKDGGHNKFLESITVWIDITAPRYWWQQFDTYRIGVTKQSESTMHTLMRSPLTQESFERGIPEQLLTILNSTFFEDRKLLLPESFLQRRIVCTNYKALRHIIKQRLNHRLAEWQTFCFSIRDQVKHLDFILDLFKED